MNPDRINQLTPTERPLQSGQVVYWMSRDMRVDDNWALWYAREMSKKFESGMCVVFNLVPSFKEAGARQFDFMFQGLKEVQKGLETKNIPFTVLTGDPAETLPEFVANHNISLLVTDFSPLKISRTWKEQVTENLPDTTTFQEVDAHNIIPVWVTSNKQEYAARTIRPKITKLLDAWLLEPPELYEPTREFSTSLPKPDWKQLWSTLDIDDSIKPVDWVTPGQEAGHRMLTQFIQEKITEYDAVSNKPNIDGLSNLSPYIHFGQISSQRIAWEVQQNVPDGEGKASFLEELIVRRELAENFCWYNRNYDSWESFPDWAKTTLNEHRDDEREYLYSLAELENSLTHDPLWNTSQMEMVKTGKMHGYIRMYWAKKILEWTESPEQALEWTIYLNDKYELDGRDPIGYTNIAWSVGGVHDHGWTERPIFGKIRFMSLASTGKKFDSKGYIEKITNL